MTAVSPLVFVVDDNLSIRKSLTRLLGSAGYLVEAFASAREFLAHPQHPGPCCLVLDVRMPGLTGIQLQEMLAATGRRLSIVFVTGHADVPTSVKAMKAGAVDLLTKPVDAEDLIPAIQRALTRDEHDRAADMRRAEIQRRVSLLTARETEVFALVVTGMQNKRIAAALGIVEKTVKVHRARAMEKMRAGSVAELVRLADEAGVTVPKRDVEWLGKAHRVPSREGIDELAR
jgi:FixJ family two-component response regulator